MYRRSLVDTGESELSNPDVTDTTTEDVQSKNEAAVLADEYLPFIDAGYASASDPNSTQPTLDKFIEGWSWENQNPYSQFLHNLIFKAFRAQSVSRMHTKKRHCSQVFRMKGGNTSHYNAVDLF